MALSDKAGGLAQHVTAFAEGRQRGGCLILNARQLRARRLTPHKRDQGRLAGSSILGHSLADGRRIAFGVEKIVSDLKGEAEGVAVAAEGGALMREAPRRESRRLRTKAR